MAPEPDRFQSGARCPQCDRHGGTLRRVANRGQWVLSELGLFPERRPGRRRRIGRPGGQPRILVKQVVGVLEPVAPALRDLIVPTLPGDLWAARTTGFRAESDFETLPEDHRIIEKSEPRSTIHTQWLAENAQRIPQAEERRDIHVNSSRRENQGRTGAALRLPGAKACSLTLLTLLTALTFLLPLCSKRRWGGARKQQRLRKI